MSSQYWERPSSAPVGGDIPYSSANTPAVTQQHFHMHQTLVGEGNENPTVNLTTTLTQEHFQTPQAHGEGYDQNSYMTLTTTLTQQRVPQGLVGDETGYHSATYTSTIITQQHIPQFSQNMSQMAFNPQSVSDGQLNYHAHGFQGHYPNPWYPTPPDMYTATASNEHAHYPTHVDAGNTYGNPDYAVPCPSNSFTATSQAETLGQSQHRNTMNTAGRKKLSQKARYNRRKYGSGMGPLTAKQAEARQARSHAKKEHRKRKSQLKRVAADIRQEQNLVDENGIELSMVETRNYVYQQEVGAANYTYQEE